MAGGGDDLNDDDFLADDLVTAAASDVDDDHEYAPLEGEEDVLVPAEDEDNTSMAKKRKRSNEDGVDDSKPSQGSEDAKREKRKKRKAKDNERKAKKQRIDPSSSVFSAAQSPEELATHLARGQSQVFKDLSTVELEDLKIPDSCIVDTRSWAEHRTYETLPDFIRKVTPTLATRIAQTSKNNGAPTCIILASNALRVTDLTRAIRPLRGEKGGEVAKLFARHFKLSEHAEHLKKTKIGVAIGTPARVGALLGQTDSLSLKALSHIILDVTWLDSKNRSLIDLPETKTELFKACLADKGIRERLASGKTNLVLF